MLIKPHHFLDIIKLFGQGFNIFSPDLNYSHDFYKIGNLILKSCKTEITLTVRADDICKPCIFLKNGQCGDEIVNFACSSKEEWNQVIDRRILEVLNLKEEAEITARDLCKLVSSKMNTETITDIWKERPEGETKDRVKYLLKGINKYLKKFQIE